MSTGLLSSTGGVGLLLLLPLFIGGLELLSVPPVELGLSFLFGFDGLIGVVFSVVTVGLSVTIPPLVIVILPFSTLSTFSTFPSLSFIATLLPASFFCEITFVTSSPLLLSATILPSLSLTTKVPSSFSSTTTSLSVVVSS